MFNIDEILDKEKNGAGVDIYVCVCVNLYINNDVDIDAYVNIDDMSDEYV
jgi:hypothetical protein